MIQPAARGASALLAVVLALTSASCISNQGHRSALADRESEIYKLREERSRLRSDVESQQQVIDSLQTQLADARSRPAESGAAIRPVADVAPRNAFPELDALGVSYGVRDGSLVLTIPSEISFASGKAELSTSGKRALDEVARTLQRQYPRALYGIEGYTDNDPIKKSAFANNRELSLARALAVHAYLVEQHGVADEQCVVAGHGPYRTVAPNDTPANKAKNRRVEIVVHER